MYVQLHTRHNAPRKARCWTFVARPPACRESRNCDSRKLHRQIPAAKRAARGVSGSRHQALSLLSILIWSVAY